MLPYAQWCSFRVQLRGLSPLNLGQKRPEIFNLSKKVCQIRGEIWKFKDSDVI